MSPTAISGKTYIYICLEGNQTFMTFLNLDLYLGKSKFNDHFGGGCFYYMHNLLLICPSNMLCLLLTKLQSIEKA